MKCDAWPDRPSEFSEFSEYIDHQLPETERREFEAHLAECAECRGLLAELRAVAKAADQLVDRPPKRDLWPAIAAELPRRVGRARLSWFAAAAVALLFGGLGAGLTWMLSRSVEPGANPPPGTLAYMFILHEPAGHLSQLSPAELQAVIGEYTAWSLELDARGRLVDGSKLGDEAGWILEPDGQRVLMPPTRATGGVGGYFVIRAQSYEEALGLAENCPHRIHGGWIEVRRIDQAGARPRRADMHVQVLALVLSMAAPAALASTPIEGVAAIRVDVVDLAASVDFYRGQLGFRLTSGERADGSVRLELDGVPLILRPISEPGRLDASLILNLMTKRLDQAVERLTAAHVSIQGGEQQSAIGPYYSLEDPSGNSVHLMQLDQAKQGDALRIFNLGLVVDDILLAEAFYSGVCGFEVFSRDYLPRTLPLQKRGVVSFVIHQASGNPPTGVRDAGILLRFRTSDLTQARQALAAAGAEFLTEQPEQSPDGLLLSFRDPAGYLHELIQEAPPSPAGHSRPGLESLAWISGRWVRSGAEGYLEELWGPPVGDSMVGTFRWQRNDQTWLYELMTIEQDEQQMSFRLHHFSHGMQLWEAEQEAGPMTYPLVRAATNEAVFEDLKQEPCRFVFRRFADRYVVRLEAQDGAADEFEFRRVDG